MHRRLAAALGAAAIAVVPQLATAAPAAAPQITDASGDAVGGQASLDIVSVHFGTTGTTTVTTTGKGKKKKTVTTYTPTKLVITETLAAAPSTQPATRYRVEATIDGCGQFDVYYANGADGPVGNLWLDCPEGASATEGGTLIDLLPKVNGSTLTWEIPLKMLPKEVKVGSAMSEFRAYTDLGDPVIGIIGSGEGAANALVIPNDPTIGVAVADLATGTATWKIG